MKALVKGVWRTDAEDTPAFREAARRSGFRHWITPDGSSGFPAEPGRYHLYVSYACPFAHRTLLVRRLKGLEEAVSISVLDPDWGRPEGWVFHDGPGATPDHVNGRAALFEVYLLADPGYTGRVTVPLLWDRHRGTAVNNESAEIVRMLNAAFPNHGPDLYPELLRPQIDRVNEVVAREVNAGVYRAGFAKTQEDYDAAAGRLFVALDGLEERFAAGRSYLVGERLTEADVRLFTTLVRFDAVYHGALNCNLRRLVDYPHLWAYTRRIYHLPGVAETVRLDHIKRHYYDDHPMINRRIVPKGPPIDFGAPTEAIAAA